MSESRIHWPTYRTKRKADLEFGSLPVEASEKEVQTHGGTKSLLAAVGRALGGRKVLGLTVELIEASPRNVRLIAYLDGADVALCQAALSFTLWDWAVRQRGKLGGSPGVEATVSGDGSQVGCSYLGEPWSNLLKQIRAHLPSGFDPEQVRREKVKFFKSFKILAEPERPWDAQAFEALARRFLVEVGGAPAEAAVDEEALSSLETLLETPLPPEFRALYHIVRPGDPVFFGQALLSPAEITSSWKSWNDVYEDSSLQDLTSHVTSARGFVYPAYTCPRWVPFLDSGGDLLCLDLVPGKKGHFGQVVAMGRDMDHRPLIAPSLFSWLERCLRKAQGGSVEVLPRNGLPNIVAG